MTTSEIDRVRESAGLPDDEESRRRADIALGDALVGCVQAYLAAASDDWDVELFFETYGRPPRDGSSWAEAIIGALVFRNDISDGDRQQIIDDSHLRAVNALQEQG